ncbi:MAG: CdaR family protein [Lachnospiraceae bacterium]
MKERITHNLGLKIMAILFAACLWLISINITDPYQSKQFNVTVQLQNANTMTAAGKFVEVINETDAITVTVRASRSLLDSFTVNNIIAVADINELTDENTIPITLTTNRANENKIESIRSDQSFVSVRVENIMSLQKNININVNNEPKSGYIVGKVAIDQNALSISGPESVVKLIKKASVEFNVDGLTEDVAITLPIVLYDENDNVISDSRITTSIEEVRGTATILETKTVPIKISTAGSLKEGYLLTGEIELSPSRVLIAGKANTIKNINQLEISEAINLNDVSETFSLDIDIKNYLPEGISLGNSSFTGNINVTVNVEQEKIKDVEINRNKISVINLPEGFNATIEDIESVTPIKIVGIASKLDSVVAEEINGYLDINTLIEQENLETLIPGEYQLKIKFELPEYVNVVEEYTAKVVIESVS